MPRSAPTWPGPVVGDEAQRGDLTGGGVGEVLDPGDAQQGLDFGEGGFENRNVVAGGFADRDRARQVDLGPLVHHGAEVPGAPSGGAADSNSEKSACHSRLRRAGGQTNASRRTPAAWRTAAV